MIPYEGSPHISYLISDHELLFTSYKFWSDDTVGGLCRVQSNVMLGQDMLLWAYLSDGSSNGSLCLSTIQLLLHIFPDPEYLSYTKLAK